MKRALLFLLLAACDPGTVHPTTAISLMYRDDVDAGVRCYTWGIGGDGISCVRIGGPR